MRLSLAALAFAIAAAAAEPGEVGQHVSTLHLRDLENRELTFSLHGKPTAVVFISALCPVSNAYNDRLNALYRAFSSRGVQLLFVNSNSNESAAEIAEHRRQAEFLFPVLRDTSNQVADQMGASTTPEAFLFDGRGILRYRGAIDDAKNPARVKQSYLALGLDELLANKPVTTAQSKSFGCTIHRVRKLN